MRCNPVGFDDEFNSGIRVVNCVEVCVDTFRTAGDPRVSREPDRSGSYESYD